MALTNHHNLHQQEICTNLTYRYTGRNFLGQIEGMSAPDYVKVTLLCQLERKPGC